MISLLYLFGIMFILAVAVIIIIILEDVING